VCRGTDWGWVDSITLDAVPGSVAIARRFVASWMAERGFDSSVAVLLVSELVANVVRHVQTELTLVVRLDPCVRIEVHDGQAATEAFREIVANPPGDVPADSPSGRGLGLVRQMASRFGLAEEPGEHNGKVVWFELEPSDLAATRT
jgi:anti-sigma regulatory factor (Ser/Thr protein kinase)